MITRTMKNPTHKSGIISDVGEWGIRIGTTSLKFISVQSQELKPISSFINVYSTIPMLQKRTCLIIYSLTDYNQNVPLL